MPEPNASWHHFLMIPGMEDNIFDISFEENGINYKGWVNPSDKLSDEGKPISFHVVLNDTSFGYLSYNNCKWTVNEERPNSLVLKVGEEIEKIYTMDKNKKKDTTQHDDVSDKQDSNAGSGAFNQGSVQDEHMNEGVADGTPNPDKVSKEKENPGARKQS
jgi:hypothetical protein